jgi:hypothetical protein
VRGVVFLQNAWSPAYAGSVWPRDDWLAALARSPTGRKLMKVLPPGVWYDNATPEVAAEPSGVCPPDPAHVRKVLEEQDPAYVVACGRQAAAVALAEWPGRLLVTPHPSYRFVTSTLLEVLGRLVEVGRFGRDELVQGRGYVSLLPAEPPRGADIGNRVSGRKP